MASTGALHDGESSSRCANPGVAPVRVGLWLRSDAAVPDGGRARKGSRSRRRSRRGRHFEEPRAYRSLAGYTVTGDDAHRQAAEDAVALVEHGLDPLRELGGRVAGASRALEVAAGAPETAADGTPELDRFLGLGMWDVPAAVVEDYASAGIRLLFPWQLRALASGGGGSLAALGRGGNMVVRAPTSGGKTLVAEVLLLRSLVYTARKVLLVVPFVSLVVEKVAYLSTVWASLGLVVAECHGASNTPVSLEGVDVAVCTPEKATAVVNYLAEEGDFDTLGCVCIDELHMVAERQRGAVFELLLTKLRCLAPSVQLVAMSATLPNTAHVASWLGALSFEGTCRPVPLQHFAMHAGTLYDAEGRVTRALESSTRGARDPHGVGALCWETVRAGHSALVFAATKHWAAACAKLLADGAPDDVRVAARAARFRVIAELEDCPSGGTYELRRCVRAGVAYHHAGLCVEERKVVERAFREGVLGVLVATSTLAAGVNLPARRVILRSLTIGKADLDAARYHQMAGRAGRAGIDDAGECVVVCEGPPARRPHAGHDGGAVARSPPESVTKALSLMRKAVPEVHSTLGDEGGGESLRAAVLDVVACGAASDVAGVARFVGGSLWAFEARHGQVTVWEKSRRILHQLCSDLFLKRVSGPLVDPSKDDESPPRAAGGQLTRPEGLQGCGRARGDADVGAKSAAGPGDSRDVAAFQATQLGLATFRAAMGPAEATHVLAALRSARAQGVCVACELHPIFHLTPVRLCVEPEWKRFPGLYDMMPPEYQRVAGLVGVTREALRSFERTPPAHTGSGTTASEARVPLLARRLWAALILTRLIQEEPLASIRKDFPHEPGAIQQLQAAAASFSSTIVSFCRALNWDHLSLLFQVFQDRLSTGVRPELLPLVQIPCVLAFRARVLYRAGFRSIEDVTTAPLNRICEVLMDMAPWQRTVDTTASEIDPAARRVVVERVAARIVSQARALCQRRRGRSSSPGSAC